MQHSRALTRRKKVSLHQVAGTAARARGRRLPILNAAYGELVFICGILKAEDQRG